LAAIALPACSGGGGGGGSGTAAPAVAPAPTSGSIDVLTYNVAGLPEPLSQSSPDIYTVQISPLLNRYDVVLAQEDFFYHRELSLYATHGYRSTPEPTPAGRFVNDGLNHFSKLPLTEPVRTTWVACNGQLDYASDCLAAKGFFVARLTLAPGAEVDVYDLHADAGGGALDVAARAAQYVQLRDFIVATSAGHALIVAGDTNLHGFDPDDEPVLSSFLAGAGLTDACRSLGCGTESIDRVMLRDSARIELRAATWSLATEFVDAGGNPLSDHEAVHVRVDWRLLP
jgi:hypothetical protein